MRKYPKAKSLADDIAFLDDYVERLIRSKDKKSSGSTGGERYFLKYDTKGNKYWQIETDDDIFKDLSTVEEYERAAFKYILNARDNDTVVHAIDGKTMKFIRLSAEEFTNSKSSKSLKIENSETYKRKMRMLPSLENILLNSNVNWHSPDLKNHKLFKEKGFENFRGKVRIDNIIFNTVVIAGKSNFGDIFYDINLEVDQILPHGKPASENKKSTSTDSIFNKTENVKKNQLEIIEKTNPAPNTYSTWVRSVEDIKTLSETIEDEDWADAEEFNPDLSMSDIQNAIQEGKIKVYSSYPIENGVFVSPSRMEAESYSGNGKVYEKVVDISNVAWIDPTPGQYAKVYKKDLEASEQGAFFMPDSDEEFSSGMLEQLRYNPEEYIKRLLRHYGIKVTEDNVNDFADKIREVTRLYNKGKNSRGDYDIALKELSMEIAESIPENFFTIHYNLLLTKNPFYCLW